LVNNAQEGIEIVSGNVIEMPVIRTPLSDVWVASAGQGSEIIPWPVRFESCTRRESKLSAEMLYRCRSFERSQGRLVGKCRSEVTPSGRCDLTMRQGRR